MSKRGRSKSSDQPSDSHDTSDFSVVPESEAPPFTPVFEPVPEPGGRTPSPFHVVDDETDPTSQAFRPAKIPDKRKPQSPFQILETADGFGAMQGMPGYPFPAGYGMPPSPFTPAGHFNPYAGTMYPPAYPPAFVLNPYAPQAAYAQPMFAPPPAYPTGYPAHPPATTGHATSPTLSSEQQADTTAIRQLELRAIFGVDHEMSATEILQRSRSLPGIRNIAAISGQDSCAIDALKSLLVQLGFHSEQLRICADQTPIEFIREGSTLLAVQSEGGFAPGVRETLTLVARELSRLG